MSHVDNGNIICGKVIQKVCPVRFIKFVSDNIIDYPFVALVYIEIHNHPVPVPERTPTTIKSNLQLLIEQAIHEDSIITIHETEIKPPGSKWSGPGPPEGRNRVEIGSK